MTSRYHGSELLSITYITLRNIFCFTSSNVFSISFVNPLAAISISRFWERLKNDGFYSVLLSRVIWKQCLNQKLNLHNIRKFRVVYTLKIKSSQEKVSYALNISIKVPENQSIIIRIILVILKSTEETCSFIMK